MLLLHGAWVQSPGGELRSLMPVIQSKKTKNKCCPAGVSCGVACHLLTASSAITGWCWTQWHTAPSCPTHPSATPWCRGLTCSAMKSITLPLSIKQVCMTGEAHLSWDRWGRRWRWPQVGGKAMRAWKGQLSPAFRTEGCQSPGQEEEPLLHRRKPWNPHCNLFPLPSVALGNSTNLSEPYFANG